MRVGQELKKNSRMWGTVMIPTVSMCGSEVLLQHWSMVTNNVLVSQEIAV